MGEVAAWVALGATCIAAIMTAANLGSRVTGWGFVVFTVGAAAWIIVGIVGDQAQLLWSNVVLAVVDVFGVWRWLGREAKFDDVAEEAQNRSEVRDGPDLVAVSGLLGASVHGRGGEVAAHLVDIMARSDDGRMDYLIVRSGGVAGVGESLKQLGWREVTFVDDELTCALTAEDVRRLPAAEARKERESPAG